MFTHTQFKDSRCRVAGATRDRIRLGSSIALTAVLLFCMGSRCFAQDIRVTLNGDPVHFEGIGPQQMEGRVLVPVRGVLEKLGADVAWQPETQTVIAGNGQVDIKLRLGDRRARVNGRDVMLDVPAQEIGGHTMVPLRFLGEALGAKIVWDNDTRTVRIATNAGGPSDRDEDRSRRNDHDQNGDEQRHHVSAQLPTINNFSYDVPGKSGWLRAGDTLTAKLDGTPGAEATFRIPGLVDSIPMMEPTPGHYVGAWTVPTDQAMQLTNGSLIGSLQFPDGPATMIQAQKAINVDTVPPKVKDQTPEPNSTVNNPRPNIAAAFETHGGSEIARGDIRLVINGKDVTPHATVTRDFISYTPGEPLPSGPQHIELAVSNQAGDRSEVKWEFTEQDRPEGGIRAVSDNANRVLEPGDVLHVEMDGTPGSKAVFSVGGIRDIRMNEVKPGHYVGEYTIRKGDDVTNSRLAVRLVTPDGQRFFRQSDNDIKISTGPPATPEITFPGPNDRVQNPLVIRGKGTPNTQVHIRVDYKNHVIGPLAIQGTAVDSGITVDRDGNWQTSPIDVTSLVGTRGMEFTVTAVGINPIGQKSAAATLHFRGQ